ncbi:hypothetical protein [Azospirillum sp. sgz302134]
MAVSAVSSLDDVLHGADAPTVRAVQQAILDRGGSLSDPAWVPFAASLRVKIETQSLVPDAVASVIDRTSSEAIGRFTSVLNTQAAKALRDVAHAASQASPAARSYRRLLVIGVVIGGVAALSVFGAGLWIGRSLAAPLAVAPGSLTPSTGSARDVRDDDQTRAVTQWAIGLGAIDPLVRARVDRLLSGAAQSTEDLALMEWALTPAGRYARRFVSANEYLMRGECPSSDTERRNGRRTCVVWYVDPRSP